MTPFRRRSMQGTFYDVGRAKTQSFCCYTTLTGMPTKLQAESLGVECPSPNRITRSAPRGCPSAIGQRPQSLHLPPSPLAQLYFVQSLSAPHTQHTQHTQQAQSTLSPDRGQRTCVREAAIVSKGDSIPPLVCGIPRSLVA